MHGQKLERKCTVPARTARSSEHAASAGDAGVARGTDCVCYAHQPATLTNVDACGVIQQATPACVPREHAPATQAAETTSDSLRCARARRLQAGPKGLQTGTAPSRDSPTRSALHPKSRARRLPAGPSPKRINTKAGYIMQQSHMKHEKSYTRLLEPFKVLLLRVAK